LPTLTTDNTKGNKSTSTLNNEENTTDICLKRKMADDDQKEFGWEKPAWATGTKLKKTGKSVTDNLAKPITDLPHMKDGAAPGFEKPQWTGEVKEDKGIHGDLAKPITNAPHGGADPNLQFQKPDWTKEPVLHTTSKGEKLKEGKEIARPIGGIKPVSD
jgi:hypothetical protein